MEVKGSDLQREITHLRYKYKNILFDKGQESWLPKVTDEPFDPINEGYFNYANDEYITFGTIEKIPIYWGGGLTLILFIVFTFFWITTGEMEFIAFIFYIFFFGYTVFSIIAYFTLPPKEIIINRKDGLITFPGWYWLCRHQIRIHFRWAKSNRRLYAANTTPRQSWNLRVVYPYKCKLL